MPEFRQSILAALLVLVSIACPAPAQTGADLNALLSGGRPAEALELARTSDLSPADLAYVEGRAALADNRLPDAIAAFRRALRLNPEARLARWYLAQALARDGQVEAALFQIDELLPEARGADERRTLLSARSRLVAQRPWGLTFGMNLQPSSNLNRATLNTEAPIFGGLVGTIDTTAEEGFSATLQAGAFRRFDLGAGALTLSGSLAATRATVDGLDRWQLGAAAAWIRPLDRGRLTLRADGLTTFYDDEIRDFTLVGLSVDREFFGERTLYRLGARVARQWYDDPGRASIYDNTSVTLTGDLRRIITPRLALRAGLAVNRTNARDPRFSYDAIRPSIGMERSWPSGWTVLGNVYYEQEWFDAPFFAFDTEKRIDRTVGLGLIVGNNSVVIRGFTPRLSCNFARTGSNVVFYDNIDVEECNLSLTRRF
ncbi:DUF560 domain-containing protein [Halovulum dunhuangense]|uniref:DUF560 domain-containing protein n=1 Tax=Halovulum dunhuangense TaxID=1505036 RepID=A0A849KZE4_9RHOB|nr:surface lipoprotein assembly modifier [Halovulum dunhuangense]NNU78994.1 DUF560 domain-containing protein [Halovulum dunhuangense]